VLLRPAWRFCRGPPWNVLFAWFNLASALDLAAVCSAPSRPCWHGAELPAFWHLSTSCWSALSADSLLKLALTTPFLAAAIALRRLRIVPARHVQERRRLHALRGRCALDLLGCSCCLPPAQCFALIAWSARRRVVSCARCCAGMTACGFRCGPELLPRVLMLRLGFVLFVFVILGKFSAFIDAPEWYAHQMFLAFALLCWLLLPPRAPNYLNR
jgi:hypothetical protein